MPAPVSSLISYLLACYLLPYPSYYLGTSVPCECLLTPCFVGIVNLCISLGIVVSGVHILYIYGIYPWKVLSGCGL